MKWTRVTLASAFLSGSIIIACSSTTVNGTPDAGSPDSGLKADTGTAADTGVTPTEAGSSMSCPGPVAASDIIAWKAPKTQMIGACNAADMAAFTTKFNDNNATFTDIYNAITSPTCQACIFSSQADANWQEIVWSPDMTSGNAFVNFGACYALAPGGNAACGAAVQNDQFCYDTACPDACTDQDTCVDDASMGQCGMYDTAATSACGSAGMTLDNECGDTIQAVTFECGNGSFGDAGTD